MFGIGPWELVLVFAIVLLLFGGKRLPGIASGLGSAIRNFKAAVKDPPIDPNTGKLLENPNSTLENTDTTKIS